MRKHSRSPIVIPPCNTTLFPHERFPPWIALARVVDLLHAAAGPPTVDDGLDDLRVLLLEASDRIVDAAGGGLPVQRWHRRLAVAVKRCQEAKDSLPSHVRDGGLAVEAAAAIASALDDVVAALVDAWEAVRLPDEVRSSLPALVAADEPVIH